MRASESMSSTSITVTPGCCQTADTGTISEPYRERIAAAGLRRRGRARTSAAASAAHATRASPASAIARAEATVIERGPIAM